MIVPKVTKESENAYSIAPKESGENGTHYQVDSNEREESGKDSKDHKASKINDKPGKSYLMAPKEKKDEEGKQYHIAPKADNTPSNEDGHGSYYLRFFSDSKIRVQKIQL